MSDDDGVRRLWIATTLGLVFVAIVVRFSINFSYPYPPGTNAAYYPLQTRTWLMHGHLLYKDLPLIFWLNAGLSKVLIASGLTVSAAVLIASRILDSIIEPWVAAPIMALGYTWSGGQRKALAGCTAAAALSVLSPPIMRMLSEFEKNSLGLVLLSCAVCACRSAMVKRSARAWVRLAVILGLAALTHVGAFAVTMMFVLGALGVWSLISLPRMRRTSALAVFSGGSAVLIALLAFFDPRRGSKLIRAPIELFRAGMIDGLPIPLLVVATLVVSVAIGLLWRDRETLASGDIAVVTAATATLAFLVCPKSYIYFDRLFLMVSIPASVLLVFIMARLQSVARTAGYALLLLSLFAAVAAPNAVQRPLMNADEAAELREIKRQIPDPDSTFVVAPHGLEWWAGYFLDTPVGIKFPAAGSTQYKRVLFLRNTINCPADIVPPFGLPDLDSSAPKVYFGRYLELYQAN